MAEPGLLNRGEQAQRKRPFIPSVSRSLKHVFCGNTTSIDDVRAYLGDATWAYQSSSNTLSYFDTFLKGGVIG